MRVGKCCEDEEGTVELVLQEGASVTWRKPRKINLRKDIAGICKFIRETQGREIICRRCTINNGPLSL